MQRIYNSQIKYKNKRRNAGRPRLPVKSYNKVAISIKCDIGANIDMYIRNNKVQK